MWSYSALSSPVLPAPMNPPYPVYPGFEITFFAPFAPNCIGPASRFQLQPTPFQTNCDPTLASSPHTGGIHVAMGDAGVRFFSSAITPYTWWYLCTPAGGETIPDDF